MSLAMLQANLQPSAVILNGVYVLKSSNNLVRVSTPSVNYVNFGSETQQVWRLKIKTGLWGAFFILSLNFSLAQSIFGR